MRLLQRGPACSSGSSQKDPVRGMSGIQQGHQGQMTSHSCRAGRLHTWQLQRRTRPHSSSRTFQGNSRDWRTGK